MAQPEVWLRGPLPDVSPHLQPVAHSLLQCREEVEAGLSGLAIEQLWRRPGGAASIGYHITHAIGSLDRLLTYARAESLTERQLAALTKEKRLAETVDAVGLRDAFDAAVELALGQVRATPESMLFEPRFVGRGRLPSTVLGLLFHAAEHTQRHVGQMVTTAKFVRGPS